MALSPHFLTLHAVGPHDEATAFLLEMRARLRPLVRAARGEHQGAIQDSTPQRLGLGEGVSMNVVIEGPPRGDLIAVLSARTPPGLFLLLTGYAQEGDFLFGGGSHPKGGMLRPILISRFKTWLLAHGLDDMQKIKSQRQLNVNLAQFFIQEDDFRRFLRMPGAVAPAAAFVPGRVGPEIRLDYK